MKNISFDIEREELKWLLLIIPILGFLAVLKANSFCIGVSPDSTFYLSAAESLKEFGEIRSIYEGSKMEYMSHYPPGYSIILYIFNWGFNDIYEAARWVNATFFLGLILLIGFALRSKLKLTIVLLIQLFILTNFSIFYIYEMAWSETPYLFFSFLAMYALYRFSLGDGFSLKWLLISAISVTISLSIRYIGVTLILASVIIIWRVTSSKEFKTRLKYVVIHGFISSLSLMLWMLRNIVLIDKPTDRHFAYHPMPKAYYDSWFISTREFFLQGPFPRYYNIYAGGLIVIILLVLSVIIWIKRPRRIESSLLVFGWVYIGFLIFSNHFLDWTPMYFRTMSPPYLLILLGILIYIFNRDKSRVKIVLTVLFAALVLLQLRQFKGYIFSPDNGRDISYRTLMMPESVNAIAKIPENTKIFSNCVDRVYFYDNGRKSDWIHDWEPKDTINLYDVLFKESRPVEAYLDKTGGLDFEVVYESDDLLIRRKK
jgi:hypothetical protein